MSQNQFDPARSNPYIGVLSVTLMLDNDQHILLDASHIVDLFFIEDIFTFVMTGKIRFYDLFNLQEKGPLVGSETISIVYGGITERQVAFKLYDMQYHQTADVNPVAGSLIEASFVDSSFESMMDSYYSRSFPTGMKYTDMVKFMLINMVGWDENKINIEDGQNESPEPFSIPYWTVSETAKFLLKRAIGSKSKTSGYLIYNSTQNGINVNVKTLNYLFSQFNEQDKIPYHFERADTETTDEGSFKSNKILQWELEGRTRSNTGSIYGGRWRGTNTNKGKLETISYDYADGIKETMLLGRKSLFYDESDTTRINRTTAERNLIELKAVLYDEWSKIYSIQNKASVLMQGNENRYCGHLINIEWPSYDNTLEIYQKQLQGLWLVKGITHMFRPNDTIPYQQKIVLIKNAYTYSKSSQLLDATKGNINITGGVRTKFLENE